MKPLPTIRERLLRIHLAVALATVLVFFGVASMLDWKQTQKLLVMNFSNEMHAAAAGAADFILVQDQQGLDTHLHDFHALPGMMALCVYGADSQPISVWRANDSNQECPQFILHEGIEIYGLDAATSITLMHDKTYLGMLYAKSKLTAWDALLWRYGIALLSLLGVAYLACWFSSRYGAQSITASLNALKEQIDCLKKDDYGVCSLLPPMTTAETANLTQSITSFRAHLAIETMPRKELKQVHHWYENIFSGLLRGLRQQIEADSPLLDCLDDYEQLLRIQSRTPLPEPVVFDIAALLRNAVQHARAKIPEKPQVPLSFSLHSSMEHEWLGHPKMLQMVLQHLLLMALDRTRQGAVCLRVGIEQVPGNDRSRLTIKLEDSGPPVQRWQLVHWLSGMQEGVRATEMTQDISWLMTGQLIRYLGGTATAESDARGGLALSASLPIASAKQQGVDNVVALPNMRHTHAWGDQPLLLVVEESPERRRTLSQLFESLRCRIFIVADHTQAMVWAPVLPFSALVLNGSLPDARSMVVKRLQYLAEENLMPHIPIWAMVNTLTIEEEKHWRDVGVSTLLIQPLKRALVELLCTSLALPEPEFYHAYDAHLQNDFPVSIVARLPELNREIGKQLRQLHTMLLRLPEDSQHVQISQQAHAVKSGSLSLGYFRLAALMAEIEHALNSKTFDDLPQHWRLIADALDPDLFASSERASA